MKTESHFNTIEDVTTFFNTILGGVSKSMLKKSRWDREKREKCE